MFNFSSNEYKNNRKMERIYEERLRKTNKESNYKSDHDIFGIKYNKPVQESKYKRTAREIFESRIDNKIKVSNSLQINEYIL
jgi:hypothetical protein